MNELHFWGDFGQRVSADEKRLLAHIKRFVECVAGDDQFREKLIKSSATSGQLLKSRGICGVDSVQFKGFLDMLPLLRDVREEELADKPQVLLWKQWINAMTQFRQEWLNRGWNTPSKTFNAWRKRQRNRCYSQLGYQTNQEIVHTTIMFELSKGCSMGCPFCGLASESLQSVFLYTPENARLWHDVLTVATEYLGDSIQTGACYWATEPSDNPDYMRFIKDFGDMTGVYPQTTTAAALRDLSWTSQLLELRRQHPTAPDRFSILSRAMLNQVHSTFSADDLALTQLILIHAGIKVQSMALSGRNRKAVTANSEDTPLEDHTIACLSGFLINMAERTVRLVSPCPPSERWPLGYQVYAQGAFSSAAELGNFIERTFTEILPEYIPEDAVVAFRPDLQYIPEHNGFQLRSKHQMHRMEGFPHLADLGRLIAQGNLTSRQISEKLLETNSDFLAVKASLQKLFDQGLLKEDFYANDYRGGE